MKRRIWEDELPKGPADKGVVKSGHVVSLNRFEAEAAGREVASGQTTRHRTLFKQLFEQLHMLDPALLRRRDRGFKVKFVGESADDYGGPFREAITNMCAELQCATSHLFILTPIQDAALERQVVSRAHRMGATGPVLVETIHLWYD